MILWHDPEWESLDDFYRRVGASVRNLKTNAQRVRQLAQRSGRVRAVRVDGDNHYRWFVRYQVLRESMGTIAASQNVLQPSVSGALHNMADLVGIPLRAPSPPGRPRNLQISA
jgi:hypothetical protein